MARSDRTRKGRLPALVAGVLLSSTCVFLAGLAPSHAATSTDRLRAAEARLAALNTQQSLLDEQYNQATVTLANDQRLLAQAKAEAASSESVARSAVARLSARARFAFENAGSQLGVLLGSSSIGQLSDRLEFLGVVQAGDLDVARRADNAARTARWAASRLTALTKAQSQAVATLNQKRSELVAIVSKQEALITSIHQQIAREAAARRARLLAERRAKAAAAARAAAARAAAARAAAEKAKKAHSTPTTAPSAPKAPPAPPPSPYPEPSPRPTPPPPPPPPPPPSSKAQIAVQAAYSVLGVPYVYAGASPQTGFDCSGLTMWAWAHAGVSLPHSAAMQYAAIPHVSRADLQPGDLLFFFSPIHHVAMYVGGGRMIEAPHTGAVVHVTDVYWQWFVGAGRP